jgi:hypothetical protein
MLLNQLCPSVCPPCGGFHQSLVTEFPRTIFAEISWAKHSYGNAHSNIILFEMFDCIERAKAGPESDTEIVA